MFRRLPEQKPGLSGGARAQDVRRRRQVDGCTRTRDATMERGGVSDVSSGLRRLRVLILHIVYIFSVYILMYKRPTEIPMEKLIFEGALGEHPGGEPSIRRGKGKGVFHRTKTLLVLRSSFFYSLF